MPFTPYYTMKDSGRHRLLPDPSTRWFVFFVPELSRRSRQLHSRQPAGHAGAHRAGMVLPAVLRDPAPSRASCSACSASCSAPPSCWCCCPGSTRRASSSAVSVPVIHKVLFWCFVLCVIGLGYLGRSRRTAARCLGRRILTAFPLYFLVLLPLVGLFRTPKRFPPRSPDSVLKGETAMGGS